MADQISKRSIVYQILMDFKSGKTSAAQAESQIKRATKASDNWGKSLANTARNLQNAFITREIIRFTKEMVKLGDEVSDVRGRFNQINKSGELLGNLRKDTKGLVDDLSLMKSAIKAENFRVPLNELGKLLEFARKRANDTGQSVETMTELIIEGVGKKSVRSLQEFGISAEEINKELARTPDFAQAIGNIAEREFAKATGGAADYGDEIDRLNTALQNLTQKTSVEFTKFFGTIALGINQATAEGASFTEQLAGIHLAITKVVDAVPKTSFVGGVGWVYQKLFGTGAQKLLDESADKTKTLREEIEQINREAKEAGVSLFNSLVPKELDDAPLTIGQIEEQISLLQKQLKEEVPGSETANSLMGSIERLNALLPKITEETKKTQDALQDYLRWIDEQSAIYDDQNEKAQEAIDRGKEKNEVLREEIDLQNKINQANADMEGFDASHAKPDEDEQADGRERLNEALEKTAQLTQNLAKLAKDGSEAQLALQLASTLASQAEAIASGIASAMKLPFPGNVIAGIGVAATVASLFGQVKSLINQAKSAQGFAEGVIDLKGEGTTKSDSIPARLSKGESVMTAEETDDYKDVLWAIRKGNFDDYIQKNLFDFVNPSQINRQFEKSTTIRQAEIDYSHRFYQQLLATGEGNYYTKSGLKYLKSIDRKLTQSSSRYARP